MTLSLYVQLERIGSKNMARVHDDLIDPPIVSLGRRILHTATERQDRMIESSDKQYRGLF